MSKYELPRVFNHPVRCTFLDLYQFMFYYDTEPSHVSMSSYFKFDLFLVQMLFIIEEGKGRVFAVCAV